MLRSVLLSAFIAALVPALIAASGTSSKMAPLQYLVGTWNCSGTMTTNGNAEKPNRSTVTFKSNGPWLDMTESDQPAAISRLGYDKNNGKYVMISTGGQGGYAIIPFTLQNDTMIMGARTLANDTPDNIDVNGSLVRLSASKMKYSESGIMGSGKNKGKRYTVQSLCTR